MQIHICTHNCFLNSTRLEMEELLFGLFCFYEGVDKCGVYMYDDMVNIFVTILGSYFGSATVDKRCLCKLNSQLIEES